MRFYIYHVSSNLTWPDYTKYTKQCHAVRFDFDRESCKNMFVRHQPNMFTLPAHILALLDEQEEQLREELRELEHQLVGATDWNRVK